MPVPEPLAEACALVAELVGDQAAGWDRSGELPLSVLRKLGAAGVLCAQVPGAFGGLGADSAANGELTAFTGSRCGSLRSVMTSHGMAAWSIQRFGDREQRQRYLGMLTNGQLAAVGISEPLAGSDLSAMRTRVRSDGDCVVIDGQKKWVTGARYADLILIVGLHGDDGFAAMVPADAPGVTIEPIPDPMGCRAGGHADVRLEGVRLPTSSMLGGGGQVLSMLFTTALSYGRMSIAWGCTGMVRACLAAAVAHAGERHQGGTAIAGHQLIRRLLAELFVAEQVASRVCEHASQGWDGGSADMMMRAVLAKHVSAGQAARAATTAVQVLASAGAHDGHVVARAFRDAKMMELIEGTNEISQLILADHALRTVA